MSNHRIAKNIIFLFSRTVFNLGLSLYISRKLLLILGESDFGIYSIVGGIAVLFSFLESAIFSGAQRFLALKCNDGRVEYQKCFSTCINAYLGLALIIFVLSETIGVYFVNHVLNIPEERITVANWVFQFSVFSVLLSLTNGPYKASIIVAERLDYYAKIDVVLKILQLILVLGLSLICWDKLIAYAVIMFGLAVIRFFIDKFFCIRNIRGCTYRLYFNRQEFKSLLSFSGWTIFKAASESSVNQGNNILINVYGGTIASASIGLANQIWGAVASLINNIHVAFTSQIIQKWGLQDTRNFISLINDSMRYSYYILIILGIPFLAHTHFFLNIWLSEVPEHAVNFCRLSFISSILYSAINPLNTGVQAIGKIRSFQLIGSLILILDLPVALIFMLFHLPLYSVLISRVIFQFGLLIFNSVYLSRQTDFPYIYYFRTFFTLSLYAVISTLVTIYLSSVIYINSIACILVSSFFGICISLILFWFFSLKADEKKYILSVIYNFPHRGKKKN